jgi:hypothetical protein
MADESAIRALLAEVLTLMKTICVNLVAFQVIFTIFPLFSLFFPTLPPDASFFFEVGEIF